MSNVVEVLVEMGERKRVVKPEVGTKVKRVDVSCFSLLVDQYYILKYSATFGDFVEVDDDDEVEEGMRLRIALKGQYLCMPTPCNIRRYLDSPPSDSIKIY